MEADQAVKFIERMFSHAAADRMAILAIPRSEGKAEQRVFTLGQATSRKVQGWLRHLNARDYDIYLCVNPVRVGSGGREKGDIEEIRRLQLDLDEEGADRPGPGLRGRWQGRAAAAGPRAEEFEGALPDPVGYGSGGVGDRKGRSGDEGFGGPLRRGPSGDGRGASDENAGVQKQEAGQGRGAGHLGLARGSAGEAGGFPRTDCAVSRSRPGEVGAGARCRQVTTPRASGTGRRRAMRSGAERLQRR